MNLQQAIETAADWWVGIIYDGVWDNGDAMTEGFHAMFSTFAPKLKPEDRSKIRAGFVELLQNERLQYDLYSDYGNGAIDEMYEKLGLPYNTSFHCPQKAGTKIRQGADGEWTVRAKGGYGGNFDEIKPKAGAT